MGETHYGVLAIVAFVAVSALYLMVEYDDLTGSVTGNIVAESGPTTVDMPEPYSIYDYNNDRAVDLVDAELLQNAIQWDSCQRFKECDLTGDGELTNADLAAFTSMLRS